MARKKSKFNVKVGPKPNKIMDGSYKKFMKFLASLKPIELYCLSRFILNYLVEQAVFINWRSYLAQKMDSNELNMLAEHYLQGTDEKFLQEKYGINLVVVTKKFESVIKEIATGKFKRFTVKLTTKGKKK